MTDEHPSQQTKRILIKDNIIEDIDPIKWDGSPAYYGDGNAFSIGGYNLGTTDVIIDHNTIFQKGTIITADGPQQTNTVFRNNINPA